MSEPIKLREYILNALDNLKLLKQESAAKSWIIGFDGSGSEYKLRVSFYIELENDIVIKKTSLDIPKGDTELREKLKELLEEFGEKLPDEPEYNLLEHQKKLIREWFKMKLAGIVLFYEQYAEELIEYLEFER